MSWNDYSGGGQGGMLAPDYGDYRGRSRSPSYNNQSNQTGWGPSPRRSAPVRWHPDYSQNDMQSSSSNQNFRGLETIAEDNYSSPNRLQVPNYFNTHSTYSDSDTRRNSTAASPGYDNHAFTNTNRRHSAGDILELSSTPRYNKRDPGNQDNSRRPSRGDLKNSKLEAGKSPRRKSIGGTEAQLDYDVMSEASEVYSVKSGKSRLSIASEESISSASRLANNQRRRSEADGLSMAQNSSRASLVRNEQRRKSSAGTESNTGSDRRGSVATGTDSKKPGSERRLSTLTLGGNGPSPFATLEIPVELLESPTSRVRKLMAPLIMFFLVVTLLASLGAAVYFAVVLQERSKYEYNDSQAKQIEFLQATLKFQLAQDAASRDFSKLTSSERQRLKAAYCKQVDDLYKTSNLYNGYRGCEVDVLTNENIEFKLYFLDDMTTSRKEGDIIQVLESKAEPVGNAGSQLKINDVTLDLSKEPSVNLVVTKKPEDFFGANSDSLKVTGIEPEIETRASPDTVISGTIKPVSTTTPTTTTTSTLTPETISTNTPINTTTTTTSTTALFDTVLTEDICKTIHPVQIFAHPTKCSHYIQCEFGRPIIRPCSGGLVFDPDKDACVLPNPDLNCTEVRPCDNINGGYFAHPANCKLYIICDQGNTVVQSCSRDLVWDPESKNCVPKKRGTTCEIA